MYLKPLWPGFSYKPHQESGIQWMLERESVELEKKRGGLLCDEMGLGKTMEILGTILNSRKLETLLLCPKAVIGQWREAAIRSGLNVLEPSPTASGWRQPTTYKSGKPLLFITNYEKLIGHPVLGNRSWSRIVLDEAHRAKNPASMLYQSIARLTRRTLWAVTATPVINDLKDMKALFKLVGYRSTDMSTYSQLTQIVSEACIYRSMEEMRLIDEEMPERPEVHTELLDFVSEAETEFYRGVQGGLVRRWKALESDSSSEGFKILMRLRQLSLHPQIYISARKREWAGYNRPDWPEESTKFIALKEKLAAEETPARWIVFCQFHQEMDLLEAALSDVTVWQYHGGLSDAEKEQVLKKTKTPLKDKHQVLLLQLQSGGVGLNLQHFTRIIFMSPWWTSALMDQAVGRAVRLGQTKIVQVTRLVLKEEGSLNIDMAMLNKADEKRGVLEKIFGFASKGTEPVTDEDPN